MADGKMTAEEVQDVADKILIPDKKQFVIAGYMILMCPAPISIMKKLRFLSVEAYATRHTAEELKDDYRKQAESEVAVVDMLLRTAKELMEWYGVAITSADLENKATLSEVENFLRLQIELNGKDDFLLHSLNRIMEIYSFNLPMLDPSLLNSSLSGPSAKSSDVPIQT